VQISDASSVENVEVSNTSANDISRCTDSERDSDRGANEAPPDTDWECYSDQGIDEISLNADLERDSDRGTDEAPHDTDSERDSDRWTDEAPPDTELEQDSDRDAPPEPDAMNRNVSDPQIPSTSVTFDNDLLLLAFKLRHKISGQAVGNLIQLCNYFGNGDCVSKNRYFLTSSLRLPRLVLSFTICVTCAKSM
jgi:hypothetical protein